MKRIIIFLIALVSFALPLRAQDVATLQLSGLPAGSYVLRDGNRTIATLEVKDAKEIAVKLPVAAAHLSRSFAISRLVSMNR